MKTKSERVNDALAFTYGYTSAGLEYLIQQWPELMRTKQGRDRALEMLKRKYEPLALGLDALPDWMDGLKVS